MELVRESCPCSAQAPTKCKPAQSRAHQSYKTRGNHGVSHCTVSHYCLRRAFSVPEPVVVDTAGIQLAADGRHIDHHAGGHRHFLCRHQPVPRVCADPLPPPQRAASGLRAGKSKTGALADTGHDAGDRAAAGAGLVRLRGVSQDAPRCAGGRSARSTVAMAVSLPWAKQ